MTKPGKASNAPAVIGLLLGLLLAGGAQAQLQRTEHTFKLADGQSSPTATLADVGWLVGSWTGEAFGGRFEEVWNPPSAGTMMGMWKLLDGNAVSFYELLLLAEEEGTLELKVKHFAADFTAWEDKAEHVSFHLVGIEDDAVHFSGISFYRISDDELHGYLVLHNDEKTWEEKLVYRRTDPR